MFSNTNPFAAWVLELVTVCARVDDKESKAEGNEHDDEGEAALCNSFGDCVEHYTESTSKKGNSA